MSNKTKSTSSISTKNPVKGKLQLDIQKIFDSAPGCFLVLAPDSPKFTILAATDAYLHTTKTIRSEIVGKGVFEVFPDNPDAPTTKAVEKATASFNRVLENRSVDVMGISRHDPRRPESEGGGFETRFWDAVNYPVMRADGQVDYIIHRVEDVTEKVKLKEHEAKQQDANIALRDARRAAINLMENAVEARRQVEHANENLRKEIAERERAEEAIREREERLEHVQEIAHLGSWELDLDRNVLTWSDEAYRIFGLEPREFGVTYEAFLERVHPDDRVAVDSAYSSSIREGRNSYEIEHRVVRKDTGEIRYVQERCRHYRDTDGRIIRSLGMVLDITERKHAEDAIRQLAQFPEENPNTVIRVSATGSLLYANKPAQKWLTTLGWQVDEPLPAPLRAVVDETYGKTGISTEIISPAGNIFWISAIQPSGEEYINIYAIDITERKRAEEALRESEATFRAIGELNPYGIWESDTEGGAVYMSPSWLDMVGMTMEECRKFGWLERYWPGEGEKMLEAWSRCREAGVRWEYKHHIRDKDGVYRWVLSRGFPLRDQNGKIMKWVGLNIDITGLKCTEEALCQTTDFLEKLFDYANAPIICWDSQFNITRFNHAFEFMTQYDANEVLGRNLSMLFPDESKEESLAKIRSTLTGEYWEVVEIPIQRKDGEIRLALWNSANVYSGDGETLLATIAQGQDITERKQTEEALQESEEKYRTIVETANEGIWITGFDWKTIFVNQKMVDMLGYTSDELTGRTPLEFLSENQEELRRKTREELKMGAKTYREFKFRRKDGSELWVISSASPVFDNQGQLISTVSMLVDITSRKKTEEALRENQARLEAVFSSIPHAIFEYDANSKIVRANNAALKVVGFSSPNFTRDQAAARLEFRNPDRSEVKRENLPTSRALRGELVTGDIYLIRTSDGNERIISIYAAPLFKKGKVNGVVALWHDITELKRTEEALLAAKNAAEAANKAKSQFLANMSHELRTPMNTILGMIDLALSKAIVPMVQDCLKTAKGSADHLLALLNDLLDSAKIESGKLELESSPFSLRSMLNQATQVLAVWASEKGISFFCHIQPDVPDVLFGDQLRIRQVLLNLAGNGIKFTEKGNVTIDIRVESQDTEGVNVEFAVRDTGIGISQSDMISIFRPFAQADASTTRRFGGTGLGLTISSNLVNLMGGSIWAESEPGQGSTFYFTIKLPLAKQSMPKTDTPHAYPEVKQKLRILLVEDNVANQKLATYILNERGHLVEIAGNGLDGVYLAQQNHYDVILMDVQMPGMDGFEATEVIRSGEKGKKRVPIIAITAHAMKGDRERCLAAGMDSYLSKPIDVHEMIALIERTATGAAADDYGTSSTISIPTESMNKPAAAVFDSELALNRCLGKRDLLMEMIGYFFTDAGSFLPQLREALIKGDLAEVGRIGHRLKGTLSHVGAEAARVAALRVEQLPRHEGGQSDAEKAVSALERECELLKAALTEYKAKNC